MTPLRVDPLSGWCAGARHTPSPNCDGRPPQTAVDLLVIHGISLPAGHYGGPHIEALFLNQLAVDVHPSFASLQGLRVSAHFLVRRDGELVQFVATVQRAWHAGVSVFQGRTSCNDFSVGIELEGTDDEAYADAQYASLITLTRALVAIYPGMTAERIVGHADIAPGRKTDPGPHFDWARFRRALAVPA